MASQAAAADGPTIVNARTGQRMRFEATRQDVLRIECWSPASPMREPQHTHPSQESHFELLAGELVFEVDGVEQRVAAPGTMTIHAGVRHRFWNAALDEAHYIQQFRPALQTRAFFELLFRLANEGRLDQNGMPSLLDLPVMVDASADVIRPSSPPWVFLRLIAALVRPLAALRRR